MKILITSDWYAPAVNGVVTSVLNLRRELEAGTLTLAELKRCIARLVRFTLKSNRYE